MGSLMPTSADALLADLPRLRRYARFLIDDPLRADDLVEATLARVRQARLDFPAGVSQRVRLLALLRSVYADEFAPIPPRAVQQPPAGRLRAAAAATEPDVATSTPGAGGVREIMAELLALPVEQREVLVLVAVEGMSYGEIAAVLEVPVATVIARLVEARATFHLRASGPRAAPQNAR